MGNRASKCSAYGRFGPTDDHSPLRPSYGGVQELAGQDAGVLVGQQNGDCLDLRALALVDR